LRCALINQAWTGSRITAGSPPFTPDEDIAQTVAAYERAFRAMVVEGAFADEPSGQPRVAAVARRGRAVARRLHVLPDRPRHGSPRMEPKKRPPRPRPGRRDCYFDLESTGKYEDVLLSAESQAARRVQIVSDDGPADPRAAGSRRYAVSSSAPAVPASRCRADPPAHPRRGRIVTLVFAKSGRIGVVSVVE